MGELALTDNVPQEQPEASGRGADCWGTCEELLLVSAVRRHGTSNWNLIASELKDRAISLSVCPVYFSEEACKQKYDSLRGRYGSSTSTSRCTPLLLMNLALLSDWIPMHQLGLFCTT
jgi:hypothetical protein